MKRRKTAALAQHGEGGGEVQSGGGAAAGGGGQEVAAESGSSGGGVAHALATLANAVDGVGSGAGSDEGFWDMSHDPFRCLVDDVEWGDLDRGFAGDSDLGGLNLANLWGAEVAGSNEAYGGGRHGGGRGMSDGARSVGVLPGPEQLAKRDMQQITSSYGEAAATACAAAEPGAVRGMGAHVMPRPAPALNESDVVIIIDDD